MYYDVEMQFVRFLGLLDFKVIYMKVDYILN